MKTPPDAAVIATAGELLVVFREGTGRDDQEKALATLYVVKHTPDKAAAVIRVSPDMADWYIRHLPRQHPCIQFMQQHHSVKAVRTTLPGH